MLQFSYREIESKTMNDAEHYSNLISEYLQIAASYRETARNEVSPSKQAEYIRKEQDALRMASEYEKKARKAFYGLPKNL